VLFTAYLGAWPCLGCAGHTGKWCNGGIPQLGNISLHQHKVAKDLDSKIPANYSGYIVLDWESWTGSWNSSNAAYQNASRALAHQQNPALSDAEVERVAVRDYNKAALRFLVTTLTTVRELRPNAAGVGYYGYPAHQYWPRSPTAAELNDMQMPVFAASSALYPSIYLPYKSGEDQPLTRNRQYVSAAMEETMRVRSKLFNSSSVKLPTLPYSWYRYHDGEPHGLELLSDDDSVLEFVEPFGMADLAGMLIWGDEGSSAEVNETTRYFDQHAKMFEHARGGRYVRASRDGSGSGRASADGTKGGGSKWSTGDGAGAAGAGAGPMPVDPKGHVPSWTGCGL
jgi:hypothetical protein